MIEKFDIRRLKRVLLYYDASNESRAALIQACSVCRAFEAHLYILVVVDIESSLACVTTPFSDLARTDLNVCANSFLNDALRRAYAERINASGVISFGDATCCVKEKAAALNACAIVIGNRKRAWLARKWFGRNVIERLLHETDQRIVIIVKPS